MTSRGGNLEQQQHNTQRQTKYWNMLGWYKPNIN